jgi:type I restriction enzyme S subunit
MEGVIEKVGTGKIVLPNGWKQVKLGDVFTIERGGSPRPIEDFITDHPSGINWIKIGDTKDVTKYIYQTKEKIRPEGAKRSRMVYADDFLLSNSMSFGRPYIMKTTGCIHDGWLVIRKNEAIDNDYLYYILSSNSLYQQFSNLAKGSTVKNLNIEAVKQAVISYPPLPEQRAIVSKIEELLSELDKGKQQLELAQQQLKVYRQAVLKWAFEGRLTNEDVKERELPRGWKWVKTSDVIETINNGYTPIKGFLTQDVGEIPFIKVYNLNFDGTLNFKKNPTFIPKAVHEKDLKRSICYPGDVLINIVGPPLGKVSIVTDQFQEWNINQAIVMFRPNESVTSKYLSYFLQNRVTINWLENTSKATAGQWNIKVSTCREIPFPHCSINQQQEVVQEIESRLSVCDKAEETINRSLEQAETLRQSILKKAFEGKLLAEVESENIRVLSKPVEELTIAAEQQIKNNVEADTHFPKVIAGIKDTDLHAGILAMVIDAHEKSPEHHLKLSHVKGEKIAHFVEAYIGVDLGRTPRKDAAGPDDYPHLKKVESRAAKAGWFRTEKLRIGQTYVSKSGMQKIIKRVKETLSTDDVNKIEKLIQTFLPFELEHAEVIATVYAGWNNLLLDGKTPTDEEIVYESRENWSKRKLTLERGKFFNALHWLRKHEMVPVGVGKTVSKPKTSI